MIYIIINCKEALDTGSSITGNEIYEIAEMLIVTNVT